MIIKKIRTFFRKKSEVTTAQCVVDEVADHKEVQKKINPPTFFLEGSLEEYFKRMALLIAEREKLKKRKKEYRESREAIMTSLDPSKLGGAMVVEGMRKKIEEEIQEFERGLESSIIFDQKIYYLGQKIFLEEAIQIASQGKLLSECTVNELFNHSYNNISYHCKKRKLYLFSGRYFLIQYLLVPWSDGEGWDHTHSPAKRKENLKFHKISEISEKNYETLNEEELFKIVEEMGYKGD